MIMDITEITIQGKKVKTIAINLPNAPLLIAIANSGYVICGYLNMDTAEKLGDACAVVSGVRNINELLNKEVVKVSKKAQDLGVTMGCKGKEALEKFL